MSLARRCLLASAAAALALAVAAASSPAATIVPNRFDDASAPQGITCTPPAHPVDCSLRGAVAAAVDGDTVQLSSGTYDLNGVLSVTHSMAIAGTGSTATIVKQIGSDAGVIAFDAGGSSLALDSLELTGGNVRAADGDAGTAGLASGSAAAVGATGSPASGAALSYTGPVVLTDVTVSGNTARAGDGGAGATASSGTGGAGGVGGSVGGPISGTGPLSLLRVAIVGNTATSGNGGRGANGTGPAAAGAPGGQAGLAAGGALGGSSPISITDSLIAGNVLAPGHGGAGGDGANTAMSPGGQGGGFNGNTGGAILAQGSTLDITNTTITANVSGASNGGPGGSGGPGAAGGAGGPGEGGGAGALGLIFGSHTRLDAVTLAANTSAAATPAAGGGTGLGGTQGAAGSVFPPVGNDLDIGGSATTTLELRDTVIAGGSPQSPTVTNCFVSASPAPVITSDGHNIDDGSSCIPTAGPGDLLHTPAGLAALADNGGRTQTMALLAGSAAIGGVGGPCRQLDGITLMTTDQRGLPRATPCDIGAFESQAPAVAAPVLSGTTAIGQALLCTPGAVTGDRPLTQSLAWLRDGSPIAGQASGSYTATAADVGHALACRVTASNVYGTASATSTTVAISDVKGGPPITPPLTLKLTKLHLSASHVHRGHRIHITLTLNLAARVTFELQRRTGGIKVGKTCVARSRRHRHGHACTRRVTTSGGPHSVNGRAGENTVAWTPSRSLTPGTYVLSALAKGIRTQTATITVAH